MTDHPIQLTEEAFEVTCSLWTAARPANVREGLSVALQYCTEWGADQELQACIGWLFEHQYDVVATALLTTRRPKEHSKPYLIVQQIIEELPNVLV